MSAICMTQVNEQKDKSPNALDSYIRLTAQGDSEAFARLYQATSSSVYAFALSVLKNSQDAEDALHDCYLNVYHSAAAYRSAGKPMAWILTIARNLCLQTLRERRRRAEVPEEDWERLLGQTPGLSQDDRLTLRACMEALQGQERRILLLHAVAGFKHREIADFLGIPLATVLSKYARASKKMKTILEKESLR